MSNPKEEFYRILNEIIGNERLTNEEAYIINDYVSSLEAIYRKQQKEIERLNNIIDELEKWLEEKQILYGINQQGFSWGVCGEALDKLNELKGDNK